MFKPELTKLTIQLASDNLEKLRVVQARGRKFMVHLALYKLLNLLKTLFE